MKTIFTADIGGTNSRFAAFRLDGNQHLTHAASKWLQTGQARSFSGLLETLSNSDFPVSMAEAQIAVIAVAGPIEDQRFSRPPNIAWDIDVSNAPEDFGISDCRLVNDFVAQAFACRSPVMASACQVVPGRIDAAAPLAVIGAGTGLGQAALVPSAYGGYTAVPSEGGHISFPFESASEIEYMNFLLQETGEPYVRAETVVSGKGLSLVHRFLTGERLAPAKVAAAVTDKSETLKWMARFYGRVSRNTALQFLAFGGIYIAGGVAAKLPTLVTHREFERSFRHTATMTHVLEKIPVFLNTNEESGLWGAALLGAQLLQSS